MENLFNEIPWVTIIQSIPYVFVFAWLSSLIVNFTPLTNLLMYFKSNYNTPFWFDYVYKILTCPTCLGFQMTFMYCIFSFSFIQTLFIASLASIISTLANKFLDWLEG